MYTTAFRSKTHKQFRLFASHPVCYIRYKDAHVEFVIEIEGMEKSFFFNKNEDLKLFADNNCCPVNSAQIPVESLLGY